MDKRTKVGIITHHVSHNYETMAQAFTLRSFFKDCFIYDVKFIIFRTVE